MSAIVRCFCGKALEAEDRESDASLLFVVDNARVDYSSENHELFNFHLGKLSSRSSYYERICFDWI